MLKQSSVMSDDDEPEISVSALRVAQSEEVPVVETDDSNVVGERFGKYLLVGEVATGGMAEVFLAVQKGLEGFLKVVVIKRVLPHFSNNAEFTRMFVDEARLAARLEHPNIVRTYEFGEVDGQYFTVMEYLPGEDLSKALNNLAISRQSMPFNIAAGIVSQVCAGLHFAHQLTDTGGRPLSLVHRDVNPANILLTYTGEVKLIDFGVAKTATNRETLNGTIKGKIAYMAPEQLLSRGVDQRSDVFSTGVVLWEILTGRPLFMRDSEAATLYAIMNDPIPPPSRLRPDVPKQLDAIVERALARTPIDRFESAEEMGNALDEFLATQPKYDSRLLARTVEELFGSTRANAKRSIAQTRRLARNVSLVMKLRSEVRADLAERLDSINSLVNEDGVRYSNPNIALEGTEKPSNLKLMVVMAVLILAAIGGGLFYMFTSSDPARSQSAKQVAQTSTLTIESTPPGAAVFVGGEPTGLKTPATLTDLTAPQLAIRLELLGHGSVEQTIDIPSGITTTRHFTLAGSTMGGRLVFADLPKRSVVFVGDEEYVAGDVINVSGGRHEVRVVLDGKTITEQTIEATSGDQLWKLVGDKLVPN
ncbi:MAG TPA: protein kinase [Kofleriaceae bacterium]